MAVPLPAICSKPIFGNEVRFRNLDRIMEDIRDIISYGYNALWIADDLFTYNSIFLKSFCDRLVQEGLTMPWSCLSRVDNITGEIAAAMRKAGCYKVYLGIESGNDAVLKLMNKNINTAQVRTCVQLFTKNDIKCAGFFLVGYPGETIGTIEETFAFALSLGLDEISFNVPYPLPGSKLYEKIFGISDGDWTIENEARFLFESEFDEAWLKMRIQETCRQFALSKTQ